MAVSLYDQAAQSNLLDTYVPINFDQLYRAASTQQAQIDRAAQELSGNVQRWSEFRSPSAVDTENFYNLTIGALREDIENLAANPDLMKTAAGRYALQSKINSLDYAQLSNIQASAQNLQQRVANISQMQANGTYNANWDDIDINTYNTINNGVLTELSPLAYQDYGQLTSPYTNLRDSYLGHRDAYSYFVGVNDEMLENAIGDNFEVITRTPQAQMHLRDIERQFEANGIIPDPEAVRQEFIRRAVQSQQQVLRQNIEYDKVGLAQLDYALKSRLEAAKQRAKQGAPDVEYNYSPTEQLVASINKGQFDKMQNSPLFGGVAAEYERQAYESQQLLQDYQETITPLQTALNAAINNGDRDTASRIQNQIAYLSDDVRARMDATGERVINAQTQAYNTGLILGLGYGETGVENIREIINDSRASATTRNAVRGGAIGSGILPGIGTTYGAAIGAFLGNDDDNRYVGSINTKAYAETAQNVLQAASTEVPANLINTRFREDFQATKPLNQGAFAETAYSVPSSRNIILPADLVSGLAGLSADETPNQDLISRWNSGELTNIQVIPTGQAFNYVDGNGTQHTLLAVEASIPEKELKKLGGKGKSRDLVNGQKVDGVEIKDTKNKNTTYVKFRAYTPLSASAINNYNFDRIVTRTYGGNTESRGDRDYQAETNF